MRRINTKDSESVRIHIRLNSLGLWGKRQNDASRHQTCLPHFVCCTWGLRHFTAEQICCYHDEERSCHGAEELGSVGGDGVDAAAPGQWVEPRLAHHVQVGGDVGRRVLPAIQRRSELLHSERKKKKTFSFCVTGKLRCFQANINLDSISNSTICPREDKK